MSVHEKLDQILAALSTLGSNVIKLDQNTIVLAGRLDAIEPEINSVKPAITQLQRAVVEVGKDVQNIRQRLFDEGEKVDQRFRVLEQPKTNGTNGHG